jgi:hypothetical protein
MWRLMNCIKVETAAAVNESFREAIEVIVKVCTLDCG